MKYKTIVIDPPWNLNICCSKFCNGGTLSEQLPYKTMTDTEIENFDIQQFTNEECDLFLWTTKAKIHTAFHILEKWGFRFSNFLVWNKRDGLTFNGVHNTLEYVLYGYKGKIGLDYKKPLESYFEAKRIKHSQKPDKFYSMIAKVTAEPRIDIFARRRHIGFDAWGNQVEKQIEVQLFASLTNEETNSPVSTEESDHDKK